MHKDHKGINYLFLARMQRRKKDFELFCSFSNTVDKAKFKKLVISLCPLCLLCASVVKSLDLLFQIAWRCRSPVKKTAPW